VVFVLVLVAAVIYRSLGSAQTGTGSLTLAQPAPNQGQKAPEFIAKDINGRDFEIKSKGIYVLTFWSTLNKGASDARPGFSRLAGEYKKDGVSFAAVYVNGAPSENESAPYAVIQDSAGRLASRYNVKRVPRLFLIQDGTIEMVQNGFYEGSNKDLQDKLGEILDEQAKKSS